jgi:ribosomal protein S18 acetylase RimI-like enzyme
MLQIRRYQPEDNQAVKELLNVCRPQMDPTGEILRSNQKWGADLNDIEEIYLKNGDYIVGMEKGKIVAMGGFKRRTPECAEIKRLRIHPDYQRRGYGEIMMLKLMELAAGIGYSEAFLDTLTTNTRAQKLFEKLGFSVSGHEMYAGKFELVCYTKKLIRRGE